MVSRQAQFGDKLNAARRNAVGRLNADGTTDPTFLSPFVAGTEIDAMALQPDGRVLVGGTLYLVPGSQDHRALARLGLDGAIDPDFNPPPGVTGDAIAVQADGKILVGGQLLALRRHRPPGHRAAQCQRQPGRVVRPREPQHSAVRRHGGGRCVRRPAQRRDRRGPALTGTPTSPFRLFRLDAGGALDPTFPLRSGLGCDNCVIHGITLQTGGAIVVGGDFDVVDGTGTKTMSREPLPKTW